MHSRVFSASVKMSGATSISRLLGLVREQVMAAIFGASGITDAFLVAYRIPNMLRDLFAEGAFSAAFVPIFTEINQKDPRKARRLLWSLFLSLLIMTGLISLGFMIFAPQLVSLFAPRFTLDPDKFQLTVWQIRLMAPFLTLISLAALFMGVLNTLKFFFAPALAPAFFNLMMIASIIFMPGHLESHNIHPGLSLALGVVAGGLLQMGIQFPLLCLKGYGPLRPLSLFSSSCRKIGKKVSVGLLGITATQINLLVTTIMATGTTTGAVSWLSYAFRLFQLPVGVLGISVANSHLVYFSEAWKKNNREDALSSLRSSFECSLFALLPAMAVGVALAPQIIHLIFERGAFKAYDTAMTATALKLYLLGLPFYGIYKILLPTFYALDRPQIPVMASAISIAVNIVLCVILVPLWGFQALAASSSLSMMANTLIQIVIIRKHLGLPFTFFMDKRIVKLIVSAALCYLPIHYLGDYVSLNNAISMEILQILALLIGSGVIYISSIFLFGERTLLKSFVYSSRSS